MKTLSIRSLVLVVFYVVFMWACQKENISTTSSPAQAKLAAKDNTQIVAATQSVMSITAGAMAQKGVLGGRLMDGGHPGGGVDTDDDDETTCKPSIKSTFAIDTTHVDTLIYSGSVTIDYGNGSTCTDSTHRRTGMITDAFKYIISYKDSIRFSSTETITFKAFHKDSVQLDGTIIIKASGKKVTTVEAKDAKITYKDGTFSTWSGLLTYHYQKGKGRHWGGKTIKITGSLTGTTRAGLAFTATITKEIVYQYGCFNKHKFLPVSGTVEVVVGGVTSTIDYGDGTCHKELTIEADGETSKESND
jgi:hypothetical protein